MVHWSLTENLPLLQDALIRSQADIAKHVDSQGMTLVHHTVKDNNSSPGEEARAHNLSADAFPSCTSIQDASGSLPLHYAVSTHQDPRIVEYLIHSYAEGTSTKNKNGDIPLHIAARDIHVIPATVCVLCKCADTARIKDHDERLPLRIAFEVGQKEQVKDTIKAAWPDATEFMFGRKREKV